MYLKIFSRSLLVVPFGSFITPLSKPETIPPAPSPEMLRNLFSSAPLAEKCLPRNYDHISFNERTSRNSHNSTIRQASDGHYGSSIRISFCISAQRNIPGRSSPKCLLIQLINAAPSTKHPRPQYAYSYT